MEHIPSPFAVGDNVQHATGLLGVVTEVIVNPRSVDKITVDTPFGKAVFAAQSVMCREWICLSPEEPAVEGDER